MMIYCIQTVGYLVIIEPDRDGGGKGESSLECVNKSRMNESPPRDVQARRN